MPVELAPELVGSLVGVLLSLLASYVPGFRDKWAALQADVKRAWMAALLVALSVVIYALACSGSGFFVACPAGGAWRLLSIIVSALVANQSTYQIAPQVAGKGQGQ